MDPASITNLSAAVTAAATGAYMVWDRVAVILKERALSHRSSAGGRQALGLSRAGDVSYRHDSVHALYTNELKPHPDNIAALAAVCGKDLSDAIRRSQFLAESEVKTSIESNLVLIGAPIAEGLTQPLLGYNPEPGLSDSLIYDQAPVDLPYRIVMSRSQIEPSAVARRLVEGMGVVGRPNWRIEGRERFIPTTDSERFLVDDYLLITKLRNYSTADAMDSGRFIVSIAGAHGTATRGIELMLKDEHLLSQIGSLLGKSAPAFQLVLRVSQLRHTTTHGTIGRRIELAAEPAIIPDNDSTWREAQRIVQRNLESWWERQRAARANESALGVVPHQTSAADSGDSAEEGINQ